METHDPTIQDELVQVQNQTEEQQEQQQQTTTQSENISNGIPDIPTPFHIEMCGY